MENLSQEEIDALLEEAADDASEMSALESASDDATEGSRAGSAEKVVRSFDFNRPNNNLSKGFERNIRGVSEGFAKDASLSFSNLLRGTADFTFGGMRVSSFGETLSGWENPTCLAVCSMEPLSGVVLLQVEARLMFAFFTKLLGGPVEEPTQVRDFTEIEMGLARKVLTKLLEQFSTATDKVHRVVPLLIQIENNPNYLNAYSESEPVLNLQYTVSIEDVGATLGYVIPLAAFDPVREDFDPREGLDVRSAADRAAEKLKARGLVGGSTATVAARFRSRRIAMGELLSLKAGDTLALEHHVERPLDVDVEGKTLFTGSSGRTGRSRAVQIIDRRKDA